MTRNQIRALIVAVSMVTTAAVAEWAKPTIHLADQVGQPDLESLFPKQFGDWHIDTSMPLILPAPDVQALLNKLYNQTLARTYVNKVGERIMLSVAYGGDQSDGTRAHRPEVCYPAQGFQITANGRGQLQAGGRTVQTRQLMSKLGGRNEPITYWTVVGGQVTTTGTEQKLAQLRYGLRGIIPDGLLVRVSSIEPNMTKGHALQARFVSEMAEAMAEPARARIFGSAALVPGA
jgi:EpsI family protein